MRLRTIKSFFFTARSCPGDCAECFTIEEAGSQTDRICPRPPFANNRCWLLQFFCFAEHICAERAEKYPLIAHLRYFASLFFIHF